MKTLSEIKDYVKSINDLEIRDSLMQLILNELNKTNKMENVVILRIPVDNYKDHIKNLYKEISNT